MVQCWDLENYYYEKFLEIFISILEKIVKGNLDEDLFDDLCVFFVDKDMIVNVVGVLYDIYFLKIDN